LPEVNRWSPVLSEVFPANFGAHYAACVLLPGIERSPVFRSTGTVLRRAQGQFRVIAQPAEPAGKLPANSGKAVDNKQVTLVLEIRA
jgi:hypothetical protein